MPRTSQEPYFVVVPSAMTGACRAPPPANPKKMPRALESRRGLGAKNVFHMINDGARLRSSAATRNTLLLSAGSGKPAASSLCHFFLWRLARIRFLRLCLLILRFRVFRPQGNYSFLREPLLPTKCSHQSDCGNTPYKLHIVARTAFSVKLNLRAFQLIL